MDDQKLEQVEFANGVTQLVSQEAGVYLAAHIKTNPDGEFNSMDDALPPMAMMKGHQSFADHRFNEAAVREVHGLPPANDDDYASQRPDGYFSEPKGREARSDNDHYKREVKRSNLLQLFLHGIQVDRYIMANQYGDAKGPDQSLNMSITRETLETSLVAHPGWAAPLDPMYKMDAFETYIAVIKGYVGAGVLFIPKSFSNGGWAFSCMCLLTSGWISTMCAIKLIHIGQQQQCYSYPGIARAALGTKGRYLMEAMITVTQFCFTIPQVSFVCTTTRALVLYQYAGPAGLMPANSWGVDFHNIWTYGTFYIVCFASLACVRNIARFNFAFMFANLCLIASISVWIYYSLAHAHRDGISKEVVALNPDGMWSMVGFAIYAFEGIGVLMPIMQASDCPDQFDKILFLAMVTITGVFMTLGLAGYCAFGSMAGAQAITMELPFSNLLVRFMLVMMILMIVFTYPIFIFPANKTIEQYTVDKLFKRSSSFSFWLKNASRVLVCVLGAYASIELQDVLAQFLGLVGAICCAPIALTLPALFHLKLGLAKTNNEKIQDICIIVLSLVIMMFCITRTIMDS